MDSRYERLATKLDKLPQGFPRTESGVERHILEKIFSPDDASLAAMLRPIPETADAVARRLGRSLKKMRPILDDMLQRGQIIAFRVRGEKVYGLAPFVIGIYDRVS